MRSFGVVSVVAGMDDVVELPPQDRQEDRRPDEPEPERRRDPEATGEQAADRRADDDPGVQPDAIDPRDAAHQGVRHGPLADRRRGRAPDEGVGTEDDHDREGDARGAGQRQPEVSQGLDEQADPHDVGEAEPSLEAAV